MKVAVRYRHLLGALREVAGNPKEDLVVKDKDGLPWYFSHHLASSSPEELVAKAERAGLDPRANFYVQYAQRRR